MIASHSKLCMLILYNKVVQFWLLWEFVTKAHSIVINTETDNNVTLAAWLIEVYFQLIVVVTNGSSLTPNRLPGLIKICSLGSRLLETIHKTGFVHALTGMFVLS